MALSMAGKLGAASHQQHRFFADAGPLHFCSQPPTHGPLPVSVGTVIPQNAKADQHRSGEEEHQPAEPLRRLRVRTCLELKPVAIDADQQHNRTEHQRNVAKVMKMHTELLDMTQFNAQDSTA